MPPRKRKVIEDESSAGGSSGLSSPLSQGDLELKAEEQKPTAAKKRRVVKDGPVAAKTARASGGAAIKKEVKEEEEVKPTPKRQPRRKVADISDEEEVEAEEPEDLKSAPKKQPRKKAVKQEATEEDEDNTATAKPAKKKRKTKEEKEAEAMPLAARTIGHKLFIGAHVSSAGGVQNAPMNSVHIGGNAFALFLKSQRKWVNPPLLATAADGFHAECKNHGYKQNEHVVPHGSYLVNLAHTDPDRTKQAYDSFVDDLKRCEKLGIKLYNFHPGVANSTTRELAIAHLALNINKAIAQTSTVVALLENMAAGGNVLGSTWEDLKEIIDLVDDKSRVGVCLDTCHAFAAGYDLRTPEAFSATLAEFDRVVGFRYLRAVHVNDSKAPFVSHRDLHANIGTGFLGLRAFHNLVNDERFTGLPLILETPIEVRDADGVVVKDEAGKPMQDRGIDASEIKLLESLVGMDVEGEVFKKLEADLARKGRPERERLEEQIGKKVEKEAAKEARAAKKKVTGKGKQGKKKDDDDESELSDVKSDDVE